MKKLKFLILSIAGMGFMSINTWAQTEDKPFIQGFGAFSKVPFAEDMPDPAMSYKIVVEASEEIAKPGELYTPLEHVARMYNVHILGGVPKAQLDVALVIWGYAIPIVMNNEAYLQKYGVDNPNLKILEALRNAGIKIFACGQSINRFKIDPKTINPDVTVALSRFTTVSTYQLKGYAFFKY